MAPRIRALFSTLVLFCSLLVHAQNGQADFVVETFPPGAEIFDYGAKYLGRSGEPITLSPGNHNLILRLDGHADTSVTVGGMDVSKGRYPGSGALSLPPLSVRQALLDWLTYRWHYLLAATGLLLAVGRGVRQQRRLSRKQHVLESLVQPGEGESRSLVRQQVGGYRVLSHLGGGGMADVYLGVPKDSLDSGSTVAIKVINSELRDQPEFVERFQREIVVSQGLAHPGIVEVREWGWHGDRLYLAMELVEGQQLRKLLPALVGDRERSLDVLSQLMKAVDYAHQRGVYHRDLKPENVMITSAGQVKVMDFGLARAVDSRTLTLPGTTMGSPKYIAPEMISGEGGDDRADQYALGVMAYEMLTGQLPFVSDEVLFLLYSHATLDPPAPGLGQQVDEVLLRMLRKVPRERYRDVEEARMALLASLGSTC